MQQICDFHLRFIRFICVDNLCVNKLLCEDCQKQSNEHASHKVIDTTTFMNVAENFLRGGMPDFILYGADQGQKTKLFLQSSAVVRQEIRQTYLKKLEEQIDRYVHSMVNDLTNAKKTIVEFVNQSIDESFSAQILKASSNRDSGHLIVQQVINALNNKIPTKEGSSLLQKLHNGDLEREFYEKKIQALIELFLGQVKYSLDPLASRVQKYLKQFWTEMEKLKLQVKDEHFQVNKANMLPKSFKIKDLQINPNLQLRIPTPQYYTKQPHKRSMPTENYDGEDLDFNQQMPSLTAAKKVSKQMRLELLKSLDFTHHTSRVQSQHSQVQQQIPQVAQYDPSGADFKKIDRFTTKHTQLLKVLNIQKNVCMTVGKEGLINIFTIEIANSEMSIVQHHQLKPHQEIRDVELCQTPGMFLTTGRNIRTINDKYVDLGFTVKLYLFQDLQEIELLTEFRDLHTGAAIEQLKFKNEQYLRQRVEYAKFSNELEFATISADHLKLWRFSYDSSKIYDGEMVELYKIELKGSTIKSVDFSEGTTIISERGTTYLYHQNQLAKQIRNIAGKDQVLRSKLISGRRLLILTQQATLTVVDLAKFEAPPQLTNLKDKPYEPLKLNLKKYLRGILFEKEEKELELVDIIQVKLKYIVLLHSSQYDHFLLLNKQFELENKFRFPPSEIKYLKLLDIDMHELMLALEGKCDYAIWDVSK